MIGEFSIMTWTQLGGILASLAAIAGTFYKMYRDNKNLTKQLETISRQNGTVENAHEKILDKQSNFSANQREQLINLTNSVGAVRKSVEEEALLRMQIQANDQTAFDAVSNLQKYLSNTKDQKEAQMMKVVELKRTIEKLEEEKKALQTELSQVKSRNLELSHENAKLKAGNNPNRGRGPVLRP
ncbi:hypothetical protein [Fructobacillus tropaeoli]|uniref:Uncharacterized protein n=1 Tax=Fructobacillus tropaeoli TaxID=709323 RepID=A0A3F3HBA9_9LACO|nr:hypothetical protein [Fructobacillus tropaeoli]GAP04818.1 hypothetical protein FTRO_0090190 [Fructobacillus tropaeoli]